MSNEFNVAVKLQADASQYTAEFTRAGRTAAAFAAELNGGSSAAAGGLDKATAQAQRFGATASAAASQAQQGMAAATSATQALDTAVAKVNKTASSTQLGASLGAVAKESQSATQALSAADRQAQALGISAKQTAAAMRGVPAQITDIVVGLQGGQAPMTVLLQQGGQLKDMFGGIAPAVRALGTAALGLLNPFVIAGGVAAALALAYKQGSAEADEFRRAIVMSGNAAGTSVGQLSDMARAVSTNIGTQSQAAAVLAQMASGGRIAGDNLQYFTEVAMGLERYVGVPVKATIADLEELGKAPLAASVKLNEQYRYLSVAVYEQIKALDEQGRKEEAASVAQNAYAKAFEARKNEMRANLGYLESAWDKVTAAAKRGWDAMLNVGRSTTSTDAATAIRDRLSKQQEELAAKRAINPYADTSGLEKGIEILKQRLGLLESDERQAKRMAAAEAERSKQTELRAEWDKVVLANLSKEKKLAQEIADIRAKGAAAGIDKAEIDKQVKAHQDKNADKSGASAAAAAEKDALNARIEATRQGYKRLAAETADGLGAIDALRQQGLLSEYAALQRSTALRLQEIDAHKAALNAELGELQGRKNMARERAAVEGQLAELEQKRVNLQNASSRDLDTLLIKPQLALVAGMRQGATAVNEQAAALEAQNRVYGLAGSALADLNIAQLEQQRLDLEATDNVIPGYIAALEDRIAAQKRLRAAMADKEAKDWAKEQAEAAVKANDRATQAIERQNEQLAQSLTDNIMRGGKDAGDYVEDYFRSLVLRPVVSAALSPISGAINGAVSGAAGSAGSSMLPSMGGSVLGNALGGVGAFGIGASYGATSLFANGLGATLSAGGQMIGAGSVMSGIGTIAGALGPIALGVGAIASIVSKLDDSGTYHTGGAAQYSAASGLQAGQSGENFNLGFGRVEAGKETISAVGGLAKGLAGALDGMAKAFGTQAGYEVAAAYADDRSKDKSWAGLRFSLGGQDLLNLNDNRESKWAPRELADGEEGWKQFLNLAAQSTREVMLKSVESPAWAKDILNGLGESVSMEGLTTAVAQIGAAQEALVRVGTAMPTLAALSDQATSALIKAAGGVDKLVGNLGSYYQNYFSEAERTQVSTKLVTDELQKLGYSMPESREQFRSWVDAAISAGESSASSAAGLLSLESAVAALLPEAEAAVSALDRQKQERETLKSLAAEQDRLWADLAAAQGDNATAAERRYWIETKGMTAAEQAAYDLNAALSKTVEATKKAASAMSNLADQRFTLENNLLEQAGQGALAQQRTDERDLAKLTEGLPPELAQQVAAEFAANVKLRDQAAANAAAIERWRETMAGVEQQFKAEQDAQANAARSALDAARDRQTAAEKDLNTLKSVFDLLGESIAGLRGQVASTAAMQAQEARAYIRQATTLMKSGGVPDQGKLQAAIRSAQAGIDGGQFGNRAESDYQRLVLAGELAALQQGTAGQLTVAEQHLSLAQKGVDIAQRQLDALGAIAANIGSLSAAQAAAAGAKKDQWTSVNGNLVYASSGGAVGLHTGSDVSIYGKDGSKFLGSEAISYVRNQLAGNAAASVYAAALEKGISATALDQLMGWDPGTANGWARDNQLPQFAVGTNFVTYDMDARIHKGEAILPAAFNPWAGGKSLVDMARVERLLEVLISEVRALKSGQDDATWYARTAAEVLVRVTDNGNAARTRLMNATPA